jgi:hypothetical protein
MPRYAFLVSVVIAACSVELAEPDRSDPFTQIGGTSGTGSTGNGGSGEEGGGGTFGGSGGLAGSGAGGFGGAPDGSTGDACVDCNFAYCPEYDQCLKSNDCIYLSNCIAACTDPNCQEGCLNTYNSVYDLYFATLSCQYLSCGAACGDPVCNSCEDTNCMLQKLQCKSNSECLGYWYCISVCTDGPCFEVCELKWDGAPQYNAYVDCLEQYCPSICI